MRFNDYLDGGYYGAELDWKMYIDDIVTVLNQFLDDYAC